MYIFCKFLVVSFHWKARCGERDCLLEKTLFWRVDPPKMEVLHGVCFFLDEILVDSCGNFSGMNIYAFVLGMGRKHEPLISCPLPAVTVTTRIITCLVGDSYEPACATGMLGGGHTQYLLSYSHLNRGKSPESCLVDRNP